MTIEYKRLSDRVLFALELAIEQGDLPIAETLMTALEKSVTRKAGGAGFTERRDLSPEYQVALDQFDALKAEKKS